MFTVDKDPGATLDYALDWSAWAAHESDEVVTATWTAPEGILIASQAREGGKATVWLTGGTAGVTYPVVCAVSTLNGRYDERTLHVNVRQR